MGRALAPQEQYREARAQLSCPQLGYLGDLGADEEDYDIPRGALLAAGRSSSPRSSSQSSLVHSHSGSVDMSDAAGPPVPCPTPLFVSMGGRQPSQTGHVCTGRLLFVQ